MNRCLPTLCVLIALAAFPGCIQQQHHRVHRAPVLVAKSKHGPPPHAPAHGYRHKHHHHGVELVFDSKIGVYAVAGRRDHYFYNDHFYHLVDAGWVVSGRLDRGWVRIEPEKLPKGLAKQWRKAKGHGKGKHRHPAKHGY